MFIDNRLFDAFFKVIQLDEEEIKERIEEENKRENPRLRSVDEEIKCELSSSEEQTVIFERLKRDLEILGIKEVPPGMIGNGFHLYKKMKDASEFGMYYNRKTFLQFRFDYEVAKRQYERDNIYNCELQGWIPPVLVVRTKFMIWDYMTLRLLKEELNLQPSPFSYCG